MTTLFPRPRRKPAIRHDGRFLKSERAADPLTKLSNQFPKYRCDEIHEHIRVFPCKSLIYLISPMLHYTPSWESIFNPRKKLPSKFLGVKFHSGSSAGVPRVRVIPPNRRAEHSHSKLKNGTDDYRRRNKFARIDRNVHSYGAEIHSKLEWKSNPRDFE